MLDAALRHAIYAKVQLLGMDDWLKLRHGEREALAAFAKSNGFTVESLAAYFAEEAGVGWARGKPASLPAAEIPAKRSWQAMSSPWLDDPDLVIG